MAETQPFKNFYNVALARLLADKISRVHPAFPADIFVQKIAAEIDALELKARVALMARTLRETLPASYPEALSILRSVLGGGLSESEGMFNAGFWVHPIADFVEHYGLDDFEISMQALYEITQRFTSEFAVRPYLIRYPDETLAKLRAWLNDPNEHVRRWISEGTRPRLPWGKRLDQFVRNPSPTLALLEQLKDDPALYVRKSVANHLNDIAKDHPDLLLEVLERWRLDASAERLWIIRHALRTLVKAGNPKALVLLGYDAERDTVEVKQFACSPAKIRLGDSLTLDLTLENTGDSPCEIVIDFAIHFVKAKGKTSAKVFKWTTATLAPQTSQAWRKQVPVRPITTRVHYAGLHTLEIQVNGKRLATTAFELEVLY